MRLLIVSRCPPYPTHLGDRRLLWNLVRHLQPLGVMMDLIALDDGAADTPFSEARLQGDEAAAMQRLFGHVSIIAEQRRSTTQLLARLMLPWRRFPQQMRRAWNRTLWQQTAEAVGQNHYDMVLLFGGVSVYEVAHLLRHLPTIIFPYESYSLYLRRALMHQPAVTTALQLLASRGYERFMFTPYDATLVIAEPDRATLRALNPGLTVERITTGTDTTFFAAQDVPREPATFVFLGNYDYAPNEDAAHVLVERIMPDVWHRLPEARLVLIGANPNDAMLQHSRDDSRIEVTGFVDDVRPALARATAFVCPLQFGAGMKNKILEAMAMQTPVVATPLSVDGIDVAHYREALLVEVRQMADVILALADKPDVQARLGQTAAALVRERYSWQAIAQRHVTLYQRVIALHRPPS